MKTTSYWPAIVSTSLITALLFAAALPLSASDPSPSPSKPSKNIGDYISGQTVPNGVQVSTPKPIEMSDVLTNPKAESEKPTSPSSSGAQSSNLPYTMYDRYTAGSQTPTPTPMRKMYHSGAANDLNTDDGSPIHSNQPKPTTDTDDWHKKNKKNKKTHHDDDQNQGSSDNKTYDGSPIHYHKPKPTSDTEDWHKKNKNEHHHHDGDGREDNATPQGKGWLYLNLPKDGTATHSQVPSTSDRTGQKASRDQHQKKHHHGDDQDQGND